MRYANLFVILFLCGTIFQFVLQGLLEYVDYRARKATGTKVPKELFGYVDSGLLKKTCDYENAKYRVWLPQHIMAFVLQLVLVCAGFYTWLYGGLFSLTGNAYLTALLFVVAASVPDMALSLPFELYGEFHVEKKYGFSTMTVGLWLLDQVKSLLINAVVAVPLLCIAVFLLLHATGWWWLLLGVVYVSLSVGFSFVYPVWIAPLFNTFTPLDDKELQSRLEKLMKRTGFAAEGIFVMDASKRSRHSNAYFTGFGKSKRVVLYDTLLEQLSADEIEAVLGHELGHYKMHHITKKLCVMIPLVFLALFAVSVIIQMPSLYEGFAATMSPEYLFYGLFLVGLVFSGFSPVAAVVGNLFSRRDEFAADRFAADVCGTGRHLCTALIKLNKENLSEVTPPKVYSVFTYNHPPLLERIRALQKHHPQASLQGDS